MSRLLRPEDAIAAIEGRPPAFRSDGSLRGGARLPLRRGRRRSYLAIGSLLDGGGAADEAFNSGDGQPTSMPEVAELPCGWPGTGVKPDVRGTGTPSGATSLGSGRTRRSCAR